MNSTVCTLFEGNYHYGVGALVNSLYAHGYRGTLWAGYRGSLPPWACPTTSTVTYHEFLVSDGLCIRFIEIRTDLHFANFKPAFMLNLLRDYSSEITSLFYFDPDITIKCSWDFFEGWITYGIATCEDVNSPMTSSHPIRQHWRRACEKEGFILTDFVSSYLNSGFVGIRSTDLDFLEMWQDLLTVIEKQIGDLKHFYLPPRPYPFCNCDQDALNMVLMSGRFQFSIIGREGMDFQPGGYTMSHAIGLHKPWNCWLSVKALTGAPPSLAEKIFWSHVLTPISLYPVVICFLRRLDVFLASAVSRFMRRV